MNLPEIKTKALSLYHFHFDTNNLKEQVLQAYNHYLQTKFQSLFAVFRDKAYLIASFKQILADNWKMVKFTGISYTAIPNNKTTKLMVGIAIYVSNLEPASHPLELLMPDACFESCSDDFPDLNTDEFKDLDSILHLLKTHILSINADFLIPVSLATTIAVNEELDQIANPYFNYQVHAQGDAILRRDEIERLYRHSLPLKKLLAHKKNYIDLARNETHLLGQLQKLCDKLRIASRYGNGSEMHAGNEAYQGIIDFIAVFNQYFGKKLQLCEKKPDDMSALNHRYLWVNDKKLYWVEDDSLQAIKVKDESKFKNILLNLKGLREPDCKSLDLSVYEMHQLLDACCEHQSMQEIPDPLHQHLLKIIEFVTDPQSNHHATQTMQTCVHDLRQKLATFILQYQDTLIKFTSGIDESVSLQPLIKTYDDARMRIQTLIEEMNYLNGADDLQNFGELIEPLDVNFEINNVFDLRFIKDFNQKTVQGIFSFEQIRAQAVSVFQNLDELVAYFMDLPVHLVELFTLETQTEICEFHLSDLHQLGQLLLVLDAERCAAILKSLAEATIPDIEDFVELQNYLDAQPFHSACASLHVHLLKSLTPQKFVDVLKKLQTADKKAIFKECFLSNMSELVQNIKTLILFKSVLTAPEFESLCTQTKTTVTSNLTDLEDFILCLEIFNEQEKIKFFMHQTTNLICWAQDEKKLGIILTHCPNPLFEDLNAQLSVQFRQLISNNLSFLNLLSGLSPEKQERLVNANQEYLLETIFKNTDSHVFKDVAGLPNYYWSLKPNFIHLMACSNKIKAFEFMHALLFEEYPSIKDKYEKLIQKPSNSRVNFFEQLNQIDAIVSEIAKLPQALTQKLVKALKISAPISTEPLVLKQKLKEYITDKLDSKPCSKKSKAFIFSR